MVIVIVMIIVLAFYFFLCVVETGRLITTHDTKPDYLEVSHTLVM